MNIEKLYLDIVTRLGTLKSSPKGWYVRNCPVCHHYGESKDTRHRFGIKNESGAIVTHCFNCRHSAIFNGTDFLSKNMKILMSEIGFTEKQIKQINFEIFKQKEKISPSHEEKSNTSLVISKWKDYEFDKTTKSIIEWLNDGCTDKDLIDICEYLISRNLPVERFFWDKSSNWKLKKRALLPLMYEDRMVGFTGRYAGTPSNKAMPRYFSHVPEDFIFNYSTQVDSKYIIVTEGVIDALPVNGMAIFGNTISDKQKELLDIHKDKIIILPDFEKTGRNLVDSALQCGYKVSIPYWYKKYKDAGEASVKIGRIGLVSSILENVTDNKLEVNVKWGML